MPITDENYYRERIAVVQALARAFEKVRHHKKWTRRVLPAFQAELPGYTVYLREDYASFDGVSVWGKGIAYDDRVDISWVNWNPSHAVVWQDGFVYDLRRQDPSDSAERMLQEATLVSRLDELARKVDALRAEALGLIEALPEPKSADLRKGAYCWTKPSGELSKRYPTLFE